MRVVRLLLKVMGVFGLMISWPLAGRRKRVFTAID